ncbi:MAG: hypothetical protein ISS28_00765 [Candidatus Cloacimonetes bacterium]|nr:hypothetical protein [Candidatus Cloacimonadota bacterium]MBL7085620.1 hypothetical protein [Candidatus Cloacimonadota bacterium]
MIVEISKEEAQELMDKAARFIAERRMGSPALMFIESVRPLHFIASQFLYMIAPFAELIFNPQEYQKFACAIEKDENIKFLLEKLDEYDSEFHQKWKEEKRKIKELKNKKKALKKMK